MKTSELLNEAADLLHLEGWTQHTLGPVNGPHCTIGALRRAGGVDEECMIPEQGPVAEAHDAVARHIGSGHIPCWNDAEDRTAEQVIATLRAAAVIEAAREDAARATTAALATKPTTRETEGAL